MNERRAVARVMAERYRKATKKAKGRMLDELVALTGYNRRYAIALVRGHGQVIQVGRRVRLVGDLRRSLRAPPRRVYDPAVVGVLRKIWVLLDAICGERLAAILPELIPVLEKHGEIALDQDVRRKLMTISAATIDRLLCGERDKLKLRTRAGTRPGTLLKYQIPIRTFAEWDDQKPGFVEIDLVGHDGGAGCGDFCQTLDVTDVASGWTETQGVINKAQVWVFEAL